MTLSTNNTNIWFCSDPHYNHKNICRGVSSWSTGDTRPFPTLELMNKTLVDSMNEAAEDDIIFCLGDWSFGGINSIWEFRKDIKCKNIHLILGNHDHHIENNRNNLRSIFSSVNHYLEVKIDKHTFVLSHYPFASWNGLNKGWIHLHGHIHSDKIGPGKTLDVGFDGNNMKMWHINDILELLNNIPIASLIPNDHHEHER